MVGMGLGIGADVSGVISFFFCHRHSFSPLFLPSPPLPIMAAVSDAEYARWRAGAPLLYDWLHSQSLLWPSLSCR